MPSTIFLDRDGVINIDSPDYIKAPHEFHFIDGSKEAIALLTVHDFDIIIITNQSVINRKMVSSEGLNAIFDKMLSGIRLAGGDIKDIFFCPHTPHENCSCRKPAPGLIFQARERYNIDISNTWMVGDSAKDIVCARNAGCYKAVLVQTGNGKQAIKTLESMKQYPDYVVPDLMAAARLVIKNDKP